MDSETFKLPVGGRADSAVFSGTGNWYRKNLTGVRVSFSLPLRRTCRRCGCRPTAGYRADDGGALRLEED